MSVTLLEKKVLADYTVRKLVVKMVKTNIVLLVDWYYVIGPNFQADDNDTEAMDVCLEVEQFHYTVWPDHGVPKYATSMLLFHKCVFEHHKRKLGSPLLIHCRYIW